MASSKNAGDYIVDVGSSIAYGIGAITGVPQAQAALDLETIKAAEAETAAAAQSTMISYGLVAMGLFGAAILGAAYIFRR